MLALSWLLGVNAEGKEDTEPQAVVSGRKQKVVFPPPLLNLLCFALVSGRHFQHNRSSSSESEPPGLQNNLLSPLLTGTESPFDLEQQWQDLMSIMEMQVGFSEPGTNLSDFVWSIFVFSCFSSSG